ncbi:hypothetical protein EDD86DRAFT_250477 [Gorgonomyces haynaldii]|nr:hypothetical protein EDD86DRAFT_250477 [Gorgonomyces haynaldii]
MLTKIKNLSKEYGPAFFVITQILATLSWLVILLLLLMFDVNPLLKTLQIPQSIIDMYQSGGFYSAFMAATALNRIPTIPRLLLGAYLCKFYAPPINQYLSQFSYFKPKQE